MLQNGPGVFEGFAKCQIPHDFPPGLDNVSLPCSHCIWKKCVNCIRRWCPDTNSKHQFVVNNPLIRPLFPGVGDWCGMVWVSPYIDSLEKKVRTQGPLYSSSLAGAAGASSALAESAAVSRSALDLRGSSWWWLHRLRGR